MGNRADLIKAAEAKYQREELIRAAEAKYAHENAPPSEPIGNAIGRGLLSAAGKTLSAIDSVTSAPTRAAVGALQDDKGLLGSAKAFGKQFMADPEQAPTGKELVKKSFDVDDTKGLSEVLPSLYSETGEGLLKFQKGGMLDPTKADVAGFAADVALDPTNILAPKAVVGQGIRLATKLADKALVKNAKSLAKGAGNLAGKAATETTAFMGHTLSGVSKGDIRTYIKHLDDVNAMAKKYGEKVAFAADETRKRFAADIASKRKELSAQISQSLAEASPKKNLVIKEVKEELEKHRARLNPHYQADDIAQIDELLKTVKDANKFGKASVAGLFDLKEFLQERARGSYQKSGQIFQPGKKAQQAAKSAAAKARRILNEKSPEIAEANNKLTLLHRIEDDINPNVIAEGKPHEALLGAGAVPGSRQARNLERLDEIVGKDFSGKAQKLSSYARFGDPSALPVDTTGKSWTRLAFGQALGYLSGLPGGNAIAFALTSPATLKAAINTGAIAADSIKWAAGKGGKINDETIGRVWNALQGPDGHKIAEAIYHGTMGLHRSSGEKKEEPRGLLR